MPQLELTAKERSLLKAAAHSLKPIVQIGDKGLTAAVLKEINVHLKAHQLIKIKVAGDDREQRLQMLEQICDALDCAMVQHIGKTLTLYRPESADTADTEHSEIEQLNRPADKHYIPKKRLGGGSTRRQAIANRPNRPSRSNVPSRANGGNRANRLGQADTMTRTQGFRKPSSAFSLRSRRSVHNKNK
ncbi:ribosome assembly RNA-binding protein YhbY [Brackiella oedipodis]|uniref:ribosome assembly RNA-binding protein YhbY n=1 Tax=Brackiella oedipodis TaxID=124225 RepID=UPI00048BF0F1|nr:ribosome assembly RNA-binding protein YhbY [Brackiella oedipodis]